MTTTDKNHDAFRAAAAYGQLEELADLIERKAPFVTQRADVLGARCMACIKTNADAEKFAPAGAAMNDAIAKVREIERGYMDAIREVKKAAGQLVELTY